ncbi:MAG: hypothetical protein JO102_04950, partial [Elusimicrobia bacterium]|nr:hypothetical protein [Elusimicrobiota bacterium]
NRYVTGYLREMGEEFRNRMGRGEVPWPQVKAMLDALILLGLQASDSGVTGGELRIQQIMFPFLASIINNPRFAAEIDTDTMLQIVDLYERSLNHALAPDEGAGTLRRFALVARPEVREAMRQWAMSGERVSAIRNAFIRADIKAHFDGTETLLGSGTTLEYLRALTATPYLAQHNPQGLEQFITAATPRATNAELAAIHQVFFSYIRASGVATDGKGFSDFFFRLMRQDAGDHWDPAFESALLAAVPPGMRDEIAAQSWELKAFLYVLALGGVPSTNELREWAFRRSPAPIPDVNVTNESQAALETLAAPLDPEKEIYTDKPDGIEERARAGTLTDEDTTYLGERLNAIERPVMLDIWNRFQERHPEPVMPWRVSDAQFNLITRFLNANRADLAGRLAGQGADQAAQDESFSHWAMPFYFQALLVELNTGRRLTEDELKYGDLYEPFAGELTLEGVTWTGDQANAAQSRRPRRVSRAEMKDVTPASLTAIFDFLPSLPADFGGAVALVERSLPAGPFRNFVLYLVFVDHVLNGENGLGVAVPEAMDFNAMLARVSGLAGERKERAFEALRRIAPLLVFDRMVSNANQAAAGDNALGRLVGARSAQTDPAVVVPQHAAERAGYDDATYAQPGGLRSQLTAFVGSLAQDDLVRLVAAPIPLNDKLAFITGYFPDATPVRDRWIERALRESNFSGDLATVARALALMSNGSVRDTLALRALERQRTDHPDAFTTLDGALAVIVQLLPEQGPMRDDILNQTAQDLARTPPQFDQIASLMVDPFSKLTRLRGKTEARIVTSRDAFRDYIKQRTPAEKAAFLLWLFGISNDKPYFLVEVEYLYHLDFDGLRTSFRSPPSKLYPDAGRTAQREFLEPFLYG